MRKENSLYYITLSVKYYNFCTSKSTFNLVKSFKPKQNNLNKQLLNAKRNIVSLWFNDVFDTNDHKVKTDTQNSLSKN